MPTATKRAEARKPRALARRTAPQNERSPEDEADFIISITERRSGKTIPLQEAMRRLGYLRLTEDEADSIICDRRLRRGGRLIPLDELLKRYGRQPRRNVER
ncbi:MAG: hypothetical protein HY238_03625 [Acidobacteria bacterium]|nr:hypothetical protein [Acidobacteriota bacterium]